MFNREQHNLEEELKNSTIIQDKVRSREGYAQNLYAALSNNQFQKREVYPILKDELWSCSWRYAGGIVADIKNDGSNYLDYYCSGIGGNYKLPLETEEQRIYAEESKKFVSEGVVTDEIRNDLINLGWNVVPYDDDGI